jgi:predicted dehydrogenase
MGNTAVATAGFTILPSFVVSGLGHTNPSDKLNIAGIGIGGIGRRKLDAVKSQNIVALADVDWKYAGKTFNDYSDAKKYTDYRKMLDEMHKDIDAVIVATPDHTHAVAAYAAMALGKHVYVEKPLTHSVYESRILTLAAQKYGVATQMGNQGSSGEGIRQICEWIWAGEIGEIKEVHAWTNRPIWPQGLQRPDGVDQIPDTLDWDLFIGPAPYRPFNHVYHPWNWRAWWDYGTGALGDMACHILDPVFKALKLQYPTAIEGTSSQVNTESAPIAEIVHYTFPERKVVPKEVKIKLPEVKVSWYDGGLMPPRPAELPEGVQMGRDNNGGVLFVGTKGKIMCGCYAKDPFILGRENNPPKVAATLPRVKESHEMDWVRACKEDKKSRVETSSNFAHSGPFNEMVVIGTTAVRLQDLRRKLLWDGVNMKFTNIKDDDQIKVVTTDKFAVIDGHPKFDTQHVTVNAKEAAESYIKHKYREGWSFPNSVNEI